MHLPFAPDLKAAFFEPGEAAQARFLGRRARELNAAYEWCFPGAPYSGRWQGVLGSKNMVVVCVARFAQSAEEEHGRQGRTKTSAASGGKGAGAFECDAGAAKDILISASLQRMTDADGGTTLYVWNVCKNTTPTNALAGTRYAAPMLMHAVERYCAAEGIGRIGLTVDAASPAYAAAVKSYAAAGFRPSPRPPLGIPWDVARLVGAGSGGGRRYQRMDLEVPLLPH
jgi:hypothetical protein